MRTVVITGAAKGIGRAVAQLLHDTGWAVIAVDTDGYGLETLEADQSRVEVVVGDVVDPDTLREARERAEALGTLTGWVNNAAILGLGPLHAVDSADIDKTLSVNLRAVLLGAQQAVQSFLASRTPGAIVNLSSIHARAAFPDYAVYDTCKGGVEALTRYLCVEYGHLGIRCNAVAPGAVMTNIVRSLLDDAEDPIQLLAELEALSPMKAMIAPEDIAEAVAFLLSDAARFVNGHVLAVDGGMAARSYAFPVNPGLGGSDL